MDALYAMERQKAMALIGPYPPCSGLFRGTRRGCPHSPLRGQARRAHFDVGLRAPDQPCFRVRQRRPAS